MAVLEDFEGYTDTADLRSTFIDAGTENDTQWELGTTGDLEGSQFLQSIVSTNSSCRSQLAAHETPVGETYSCVMSIDGSNDPWFMIQCQGGDPLSDGCYTVRIDADDNRFRIDDRPFTDRAEVTGLSISTGTYRVEVDFEENGSNRDLTGRLYSWPDDTLIATTPTLTTSTVHTGGTIGFREGGVIGDSTQWDYVEAGPGAEEPPAEPAAWVRHQTISDEANDALTTAMSPDGTWLAVGHLGGNVRLYHWNDVDEVYEEPTGDSPLTEPGNHANGLAFSPDGQWLAVTSHDQRVHIYSVGGAWTHERAIFASAFTTYSPTWHPTDDMLAFGSADSDVYVYDTGPADPVDWDETTILTDATDEVRHVRFSNARGSQDPALAFGGVDTNTYLVNTATWSTYQTFTDSGSAIGGLDFNSGVPGVDSHAELAVVTGDPALYIYDLDTDTLDTTVTPSNSAFGASYSPDDDYLAYGEVSVNQATVLETTGWTTEATLTDPGGVVGYANTGPLFSWTTEVDPFAIGGFLAVPSRDDSTYVYHAPIEITIIPASVAAPVATQTHAAPTPGVEITNTITGTATVSDSAQAGATIRVLRTDSDPPEIVTTETTDGAGAYEATVPAGGTYHVSASYDSGTTQYHALSEGFVSPGDTVDFDLEPYTAPSLDSVDFELREVGVTGSPTISPAEATATQTAPTPTITSDQSTTIGVPAPAGLTASATAPSVVGGSDATVAPGPASLTTATATPGVGTDLTRIAVPRARTSIDAPAPRLTFGPAWGVGDWGVAPYGTGPLDVTATPAPAGSAITGLDPSIITEDTATIAATPAESIQAAPVPTVIGRETATLSPAPATMAVGTRRPTMNVQGAVTVAPDEAGAVATGAVPTITSVEHTTLDVGLAQSLVAGPTPRVFEAIHTAVATPTATETATAPGPSITSDETATISVPPADMTMTGPTVTVDTFRITPRGPFYELTLSPRPGGKYSDDPDIDPITLDSSDFISGPSWDWEPSAPVTFSVTVPWWPGLEDWTLQTATLRYNDTLVFEGTVLPVESSWGSAETTLECEGRLRELTMTTPDRGAADEAEPIVYRNIPSHDAIEDYWATYTDWEADVHTPTPSTVDEDESVQQTDAFAGSDIDKILTVGEDDPRNRPLKTTPVGRLVVLPNCRTKDGFFPSRAFRARGANESGEFYTGGNATWLANGPNTDTGQHWAEWDFDIEYTIPSIFFGIKVRDTMGTTNGAPGFEWYLIDPGGSETRLDQNSQLGMQRGIRWSEVAREDHTAYDGRYYRGGDLEPGEYTIGVRITDSAEDIETVNYYVDQVAWYDARYLPETDAAWNNSVANGGEGWNSLHQDGGHLDGPPVSGDIPAAFNEFNAGYSVEHGRITVGSSSSYDEEGFHLQLSNDGGRTWHPEQETNTRSVSVDFPTYGTGVIGRAIMSAYSPSGARNATPRFGYQPMWVSTWNLEITTTTREVIDDIELDGSHLQNIQTLHDDADMLFVPLYFAGDDPETVREVISMTPGLLERDNDLTALDWNRSVDPNEYANVVRVYGDPELSPTPSFTWRNSSEIREHGEIWAEPERRPNIQTRAQLRAIGRPILRARIRQLELRGEVETVPTWIVPGFAYRHAVFGEDEEMVLHGIQADDGADPGMTLEFHPPEDLERTLGGMKEDIRHINQ